MYDCRMRNCSYLNEKRTCIKKRNLDLALAIMAAILIIVFAFLQKQSVIKTLPTLITLVVQIFMVKANRVAFLVGGANAVLYGFSYYSEGLCFSAISNALISAPIMIFSFFIKCLYQIDTTSKGTFCRLSFCGTTPFAHHS